MPFVPFHAPRWRTAGRWLLLAAALAVALLAACADWREVFPEDRRVFFVDADCYARMSRVRLVCDDPGRVLAVHEFENYPFGTRPHTTALLDYLIWTLRGVLGVFTAGRDARDLAGAWISPLLGLVAMAAGGSLLGRAGWWAWLPGLLILAGSPVLAHGFALGRPDHQSLALACVAWALAAEWTLWRAPSVGWGWVSGVAWALGLWTSLYEPLILLAAVVVVAAVFHQAVFHQRARLPGLAAGVAILGLALAVEGWRIDALPGVGTGGGAPFFAAWSAQIGELRGVTPWNEVIFRWTGWGLWIAPVLLCWPRRGEDEEDSRGLRAAQALLLLAVWGLTCWQVRWGYFLPVVYALTLPGQIGAVSARWRPALAVTIVLGLWPLAADWRTHLHPPPESAEAAAEARADNLRLRETAEFLASAAADEPSAPARGVLAPWWQCPALVYWSGQPAVAGSSHESLPGIVDTARFYLETDARVALDLLRERQVRWVIAYEPQRVLDATAAPLLGRPVPPRCLGNVLYLRPRFAPTFLRLTFANEYFKVYEVQPPSQP